MEDEEDLDDLEAMEAEEGIVIPAPVEDEAKLEREASMVAILKMGKDLCKASASLKGREARYLVDAYYIMQENRKREDNQILALTKSGEPHVLITWLSSVNTTAEKIIRGALAIYADSQPLGQWAQSICGIGPVITAGLLAHIDLTKTTTVGGVWRFAGLDPTRSWYNETDAENLIAKVLGKVRGELTDQQVELVAVAANTRLSALKGMRWEKKDNVMQLIPLATPFTVKSLVVTLQRRPYNAKLLTLCWKIGESFVKVMNNPNDVYGHLFIRRKAWETDQNDKLTYKPIADAILSANRIKKREVIATLKTGKLTKGHIHSRAKRWTVKLFLSHYHEVGRKLLGLPVPAPWIMRLGDHVDKMEPPNMPECIKNIKPAAIKIDPPADKINPEDDVAFAVSAVLIHSGRMNYRPTGFVSPICNIENNDSLTFIKLSNPKAHSHCLYYQLPWFIRRECIIPPYDSFLSRVLFIAMIHSKGLNYLHQ